MRKLSLYKKFLIAGSVLVGVFNPLSVVLWNDAITTGLNFLAKQLVDISNYTVIVGGTLIVVGFIMYLDQNNRKETARLKKLKHIKTEKAGELA